MLFLLLFGLLSVYPTRQQLCEEALEFIRAEEQLVLELAEHAEELYERREDLVENRECSKHACSNDFQDAACVDYLGQHPECDLPRRRVDLENSVVRTPPGIYVDDLTNMLKQSICVYKDIENFIKENDGPEYLSTYIGTTDGHFRIFPGIPRDRRAVDGSRDEYVCKEYDPRRRPWYIGASTGPKDLVVLLDVSASMNVLVNRQNETKWDLVKRAANKTLDTLTIADHVNVVVFSNESRALWTRPGLAQATAENIETIKAAFNEVSPADNTHFAEAFERAFPLLWEHCDDEGFPCSSCRKIILFLTDGRDTSAKNGESIKPSEMAEVIEKLQHRLETRTGKRAAIFTYSMSEEADDAIPRQIACANDGAWAYVGPNTDPLDALLSYYLYTAAGLRGRSPVWIEPYESASGQGIVTTVAMPIYARVSSRGALNVFLGVVGHDVFLNELQVCPGGADEVIHELTQRSARCGFSQETPCGLQVYRHAHEEKSLCADPLPIFEEEGDGSEDRTSANSTANDRMTSLCYEFRGDFYRRSIEEVPWPRAISRCRSQGGKLVSIDDREELAFVARLAALDGSWVGARRSGYSEFSWLDEELPVLHDNSDFWGIQEPLYIFGDEECAAIDSRGIVANMHAKRCDKRLSYICKFETARPCNGRVAALPEEGYIKIPGVDACAEVMEVLEPIPSVQKLTSAELVCDFGESNRGNRDVICCAA